METYKKLSEEAELVHSLIAALIIVLSETRERTASENRNVYIANCNQLILHLHARGLRGYFLFAHGGPSCLVAEPWMHGSRITS